MDAVEISDTLHRQADEIVQRRGLGAVLTKAGRALYTGSYSLNTMAWPDIDVSLVMEPEPRSLDAFFELGRELVHLDGVFSAKFDDFVRTDIPGRDELMAVYPRGYYWGLRMETGNGFVPWKIDIWAVQEETIRRNKALMDRFREALTPETRARIVEIKRALITPEGRTPMNSGLNIYEAVLFKGLRREEEIRAYLRRRGVQGV
jgi:hypothetical protein